MWTLVTIRQNVSFIPMFAPRVWPSQCGWGGREGPRKALSSAPVGTVMLQQVTDRSIVLLSVQGVSINSLRPRQDGRHFPDGIFKRIFLNENVWILIKISLKFVPKGLINNIPALVQIMAWRRPGDKPLSQAMMVVLLTHICVTRPQWAWNANT